MSCASNQCAGWSLSLPEVKCVLSSWGVARRCRFWPEASTKKSPLAKAKAPSETGGAPTHALAGDAFGMMLLIVRMDGVVRDDRD